MDTWTFSSCSQISSHIRNAFRNPESLFVHHLIYYCGCQTVKYFPRCQVFMFLKHNVDSKPFKNWGTHNYYVPNGWTTPRTATMKHFQYRKWCWYISWGVFVFTAPLNSNYGKHYGSQRPYRFLNFVKKRDLTRSAKYWGFILSLNLPSFQFLQCVMRCKFNLNVTQKHRLKAEGYDSPRTTFQKVQCLSNLWTLKNNFIWAL